MPALLDHAVRPAVYWFWDHIPGQPEAEKQLAEIAAAGIGTVLIQTRLSFPREHYLSDEYLGAYRAAVQSARDLGLAVSVYDEYAWISGHGGGRTVAGADHLRERHLFWSTSAADSPRRVSVSGIDSWWLDGLGGAERTWLYDDGVRVWDEWEVIAAVAHPAAGASEAAPTRDVSGYARCDGGPDGATVLVAETELPPGWVVSVFLSARCASSRLINYLDPGAAERFLEVVYEPYARACEGLLGDPITGFCFDHPYGGFYDWAERRGDGLASQVHNTLMWHPTLAAALSGDAEELGDRLFRVLYDASDTGRLARCEFFATYAALGIQSFFTPLARWCAERGVGLSGHELLAHVGGWDLNGAFGEVDARTNFGLDYFNLDAHRSTTLVDAANFEAQLSPRLGDSVARAHGRQRCIVEQYAARNDGPGHYAGGSWELRPDQLRLQALRHHLLGARQFLFHAVSQSDGSAENADVLTNPRFDFPPAVNFEPWFGHFRALAEESAAVSAFIEGAEPHRPVALVYPLATVWADGPGHAHAGLVGAWAQLLARGGVGYDLIDDRALAEARVEGGEIILGAHRYGAVILAGASTLPSARCLDVLEALEAGGGHVWASAPLPDLCADGARLEPRLTRRRLTAICANDPFAGVPDQVPDLIAGLTGPAIDLIVGGAAGTLWRWYGLQPDGAWRLVLLNDGPERRDVVVAAFGTERRLTLEPEAVACLLLAAPRALTAGWTLSLDGSEPVSIAVDRGWERQGYPEVSGVGRYELIFDAPWLADAPDGQAWTLELAGVGAAVTGWLNGEPLGARGWGPFRFGLVPGRLMPEANRLVLEVASSAANRYYANTPFAGELQPSGLTAAPVIVPTP